MLYTREKLLKAASITTGVSDFGNNDFIEPLDILIHDYRTSAKLNWKGQVGAWVYLHRMLCNRLRLNHYWQSREVRDQPILRPIFILGLPRTGSTLLHEMLSSHPDLRAPRFWEASMLPGKDRLDRVRRAMAAGQITIMDYLAPGFRRIHALGNRLPHECITMQAPSLRSMQFHAAHDLQRYNQWLTQCDWQPAYDYHQRYLKWLQHDEPARRWVLKAPGHLLSIPALFNTYPDATIVQLHRDPAEVIPSMASLFQHIRQPFTRAIDLVEIGRDVTAQWRQGITCTMQYRDTHPELETRFLDVDYSTLTRSPIDTVVNILAFAGVREPDAARASLQAYLRENPKARHGTHQYSLAQFGLSREALHTRFSEYNRRYDLIE